MNLTKEQTQAFLASAALGPCILGTFITGKIEAGSKVNDKTGQKEGWAGLTLSVLVGRDVATIKVYENDASRIAALIKSKEMGKDDEFMPAKAGAPVVVQVTNLVREKGLTLAQGQVVSL